MIIMYLGHLGYGCGIDHIQQTEKARIGNCKKADAEGHEVTLALSSPIG